MIRTKLTATVAAAAFALTAFAAGANAGHYQPHGPYRGPAPVAYQNNDPTGAILGLLFLGIAAGVIADAIDDDDRDRGNYRRAPAHGGPGHYRPYGDTRPYGHTRPWGQPDPRRGQRVRPNRSYGHQGDFRPNRRQGQWDNVRPNRQRGQWDNVRPNRQRAERDNGRPNRQRQDRRRAGNRIDR